MTLAVRFGGVLPGPQQASALQRASPAELLAQPWAEALLRKPEQAATSDCSCWLQAGTASRATSCCSDTSACTGELPSGAGHSGGPEEFCCAQLPGLSPGPGIPRSSSSLGFRGQWQCSQKAAQGQPHSCLLQLPQGQGRKPRFKSVLFYLDVFGPTVASRLLQTPELGLCLLVSEERGRCLPTTASTCVCLMGAT